MNWLAWIVLAALAVAVAIWLVRRFRTENRKIDGMLRDFHRENPRREPGSPSPARRLAGLRRRRRPAFSLFGAVCATGLAFAGPAIADEPGFGGYFGVAAEYPPGTCIDVPDST